MLPSKYVFRIWLHLASSIHHCYCGLSQHQLLSGSMQWTLLLSPPKSRWEGACSFNACLCSESCNGSPLHTSTPHPSLPCLQLHGPQHSSPATVTNLPSLQHSWHGPQSLFLQFPLPERLLPWFHSANLLVPFKALLKFPLPGKACSGHPTEPLQPASIRSFDPPDHLIISLLCVPFVISLLPSRM